MIREETLQYYYRKALQGSQASEEVLRAYNQSMSARANARMKSLERAGLDYYAYDKAKTYVEHYNSNYFTVSKKKLPLKKLVEQLRVLNQFLSSESSTIKGQRAIAKRNLETFRRKGYDIPISIEKEFLRFLGSERVQYAFEVSGSSAMIVDRMSEVVRNAKNKRKALNRLMTQFDYYSRGEIRYDDLMDYIDIHSRRE